MEHADNRLVERYFPAVYYLAMENKAFRNRVKDALADQGMSIAELGRRSKVPYHTIQKFLKRDTGSTSADTAGQIARALGIKVDDDAEFEELKALYYSSDPEIQQTV